MNMVRILSVIMILSIAGCGKMDVNSGYLNVRLMLAPGSQQADITDVVITVSAPDIETQEFKLDVNGKKASGFIVVPDGENRLFVARAYSANGVVEYEGEKLVESLRIETLPVLEMRLEPVPPAVKFSPSEINTNLESIFQAEINLERMIDIFGFSFELEYDSKIIEPVEFLQGNFLGNDIVFLSMKDPGKISIGASRKSGMGGVIGSGVIVKAKFKALNSGITEVKIIKNKNFAMSKEDGTNVDRFGEIVVGSLKVIVK